MTYTLFCIPDYQFQKVFLNVSLGNNFLLFFCGGPLVVEAPVQLPNLPPPLNPALNRQPAYRRLNLSKYLHTDKFAICV